MHGRVTLPLVRRQVGKKPSATYAEALEIDSPDSIVFEAGSEAPQIVGERGKIGMEKYLACIIAMLLCLCIGQSRR